MKAIRIPLLIVIGLGAPACSLFGPKDMFNLFFGSTTKPPVIADPVREDVRLAVLWAGRSTMLIQVKDKLILTDPFLSDFAGGMMRRVVSAGIDLESLLRLDLVLLSHAHFDHLCYASLGMIAERFPGAALAFPQGVEPFLPDVPLNLVRLKTFDFKERLFGQKETVEGVAVTPVYAGHSGGRYQIDSMIWGAKGHCGFILEYDGLTVYYSGDTSYDPKAFKEIGRNYDIDVALVQVGPCRECYGRGTSQHASSSESLELFLDLRADFMIPVHYGALPEGTEPHYPAQVLKDLIGKREAESPDLKEGRTPRLRPVGAENIKALSLRDRVLFLTEGQQVLFR